MTICAISTPPGCGGIAVARVSGPKAIEIVDAIWKGKPLSEVKSHSAHFGIISNSEGDVLDQAVATVFRAPKSFTGEDVVEISVHGSIFIQKALLESLIEKGARIADPGEFTQRAFLNGRIDLAEAEAVADMIASSSSMAHALAVSQLQGHFSSKIENVRNEMINLAALLELELDFSEEDVEFADRSKLLTLAEVVLNQTRTLASSFRSGNAIKEGVNVAIVGRPNAGKSSLLNALVNYDRAIVSDIPGTTRDTIEATTQLGGILFRFIDTAGLRSTDDPIESLGIDRAFQAISNAQFIIWLIPPDLTKDQADVDVLEIKKLMSADASLIPVFSKADLCSHDDGLSISALTGAGIQQLIWHLVDSVMKGLPEDASMVVTNARHYALLLDANNALQCLVDGINNGLTPDLLAEHLRDAINSLASITGQISSETILSEIFSRFCIGK